MDRPASTGWTQAPPAGSRPRIKRRGHDEGGRRVVGHVVATALDHSLARGIHGTAGPVGGHALGSISEEIDGWVHDLTSRSIRDDSFASLHVRRGQSTDSTCSGFVGV